MKTFCDNNFNEDFDEACSLATKKFSHDEIYQIVKNGRVVQKQMAVLNIDSVNDYNEARLLLNNLTGCDGKIREAVAYKISSILDKDIKKSVLFLNDINYTAQILADATIDINGNICKFVLNIVSKLKENETFAKLYTEKLQNMIYEAFCEIDKFIYKDKKYVINKQLFKLYWCLEALKIYSDIIEGDILLKILDRASLEQEYTIREKVAQILIKLNDKQYDNLKLKLSADSNYYVRKVFE